MRTGVPGAPGPGRAPGPGPERRRGWRRGVAVRAAVGEAERRVALQGVERDGEQLLRVEGSQLLGQGLGVCGVDVHGLVLLRAGVHFCAC